jgi:pyruvate-ferredoxin/flavodoxin oxidoreductase
MTERWSCVDGNEAAALIAHKLTGIIAIYPITPASAMGELADAWSARGRTNLWGGIPEVIQMQSEAGAVAALHGALQKGSLATTFTASQGLLLMLPNLFKIAGELLPCVIHVAARTVATHALSIFGDHSDVMAARTTGFALLASSSVQEVHDFALIAHAVSLRARVPFLHFFDGFRTSHEVNKIALLEDDDIAALIDEDSILANRHRRLTPDRPVLRGSAQNPDVFFQAREAANPFYAAVPRIVEEAMEALAARVGRRYGLVEYEGAPDAERVIVLMGSGVGAVQETVEALALQGERVGLIKIRLYRPFPARELVTALPESVTRIAVLDRTKEPGAPGEPLYQDVVVALAEGAAAGTLREGRIPKVVGGRYGLASKEFTPAMVKAVFDALREENPLNHFTVGIVDDVSHKSLPVDPDFAVETRGLRAVFYGLGSDGTVGAAKSSIKIIGDHTDLHIQAYFVYDSKKSGGITTSHLRFGPDPVRSTYLIERAEFVACHRFDLLERLDVLAHAAEGATFLLNSPFGAEEVWGWLPREVQQQIIDKKLAFWVIDADRVAREAGMGNRINTVMQPCFFALSGVLPRDEAIAAIRQSIERTYGRRGRAVVRQNLAAVERARDELHRVSVPEEADSSLRRRPPVPPDAPDFVQRVTARLLAGEGDLLPVSAFPPDGTFPTGTTRYEKRALAHEIPIWDPSICIDCGKCAAVCPHAAIRMKVYPAAVLDGVPETFLSKDFRSRELSGHKLSIQVAPDDCTGCGICVNVCPAKSKEEVKHKSINMRPAAEHRDRERRNFEAFLAIPPIDGTLLPPTTMKGAQAREPLFEFSGACAGCGETPYLKLLSQLFGDRMVVANATGCSSIYGGNLPTTPWSTDREGRGPAWANSLFEDNAEFGFGMLVAFERQVGEARQNLQRLAPRVGDELARALLECTGVDDATLAAQRERVAELKRRLAEIGGEEAATAQRLSSLADELVRKSIWIVGGDGWAYDIGSAGLDHVLTSGRNVNILVLDTQVYSNTGGQASKATPRGAVAKFAAGGKSAPRKDLGMIATAYGNAYVAQVALGADDRQTLNAFLEADAWEGPSLIIAYSTCIAHGIDMARSMSQQRDAVRSGFWPLYHFHPGLDPHERPFHLDSRPPSLPLRDHLLSEARFAVLELANPERLRHLLALAQADADERWRFYEQLAQLERTIPHETDPEGPRGQED